MKPEKYSRIRSNAVLFHDYTYNITFLHDTLDTLDTVELKIIRIGIMFQLKNPLRFSGKVIVSIDPLRIK